MQVVVDTNVLVAGLRRSGGASHYIIRAVVDGQVVPLISVPLVLAGTKKGSNHNV